MPLLDLVQARPWFRSSMWISSVASISRMLCTSVVATSTTRRIVFSKESYSVSEKNGTRTNMTSVIRIYLLYLQTVLITASPVSQCRMQVSNMFTVNFIFCPSKANSWRLKSISYNRNELKQCINTWQITEVSNSTKRHADNSGKHADL